MDSNALRARFLGYFESHGHTPVPSSSLVPGNDPTLLFTNAGMNQFKDAFLGREKRAYVRAASSQKCVRAGGKHNDLENVGYTARHHTFFEMLGNFSFGDYFKRDAIRYAWEFLTSKSWLGIDSNRLMVTVYHTDDEAFDIWTKEVGVPFDRVVRIGDKPGGGSDNFWQMGETGPCGPCSEIFFDHGAHIPGGPPGSPNEDGDRWVEIWNLVFMQFDRSADGTLAKLPAPSVDTGMGLERVSAVMQGVTDNYDIDLFRALIAAVKQIAGDAPTIGSHKVIADHIRATSFLICDGVTPSNEGRGYVLRRIMRRAIRHGYKLGLNEAFFFKLVQPLAQAMSGAYPVLEEKRSYLERVIRQEEDAFAATLDKGMKLLEGALAKAAGGTLDGATAFKLYDTYGFPLDLTADIGRERGIAVDTEGFERELQKQRERSQAAGSFTADYSAAGSIDHKSEFTGYTEHEHPAKVVALLRGGAPVQALAAGEEAVVFLDRTPFYAESGGQVGDTGALSAPGVRFAVHDTQALNPGSPGHAGKLETGALRVGDHVKATIDLARRRHVMRNHSATHLLHAALRKVLGTHVQQKGSLVAPDKLRFDFSHFQPMTADEIAQVERLVNAEIVANHETGVQVCGYQDALKAGAMALFGEKYGDVVRVLKFGEFSTELCGGTHVARTGDIGLLKVVSEGGIQSGVRRIEAVTGEGALAEFQKLWAERAEVAGTLGASVRELPARAAQLREELKARDKEIAALKGKIASRSGGDLTSQVREIAGVKFLAAQAEGVDAGGLRTLLDQLKGKLGSGAIVLGSAADGKVALIAGVTPDLTAKIKAGELVNHVASQVGGKGGGRPDMAQAGGTNPAALPAALESVGAWIEKKLQ